MPTEEKINFSLYFKNKRLQLKQNYKRLKALHNAIWVKISDIIWVDFWRNLRAYFFYIKKR